MTDALIQWIDGRHTTVYDVKDLPHLRKSAGGTGFLYYNPHNDRYEQYRAIQIIPDELKQRIQTRSASIAARKSRREQEGMEKLPSHLRLHRIYGL